MTRLCQFAVAVVAGVCISFALTGCSHDRPESLGSNAVLAAEGNKTLAYTAPSDGIVTVYDTHDDDVLYSGRVKKGDSIVTDIEHDRISINGRTMSQRHLDHLHDHRIYFEPAVSPLDSSADTGNSSTVTRTTRVETRTESTTP